MMKSLVYKAGAAALLFLLVFQVANAAGDVVVISNSGITVSADEIRDIFLGEKQFTGSTKLVVIDNAAVQGNFLSKVMHMDVAKYNGIWIKKSFRDGLTPPAVKSGDAEVIEFVKRTPGTIGYVSALPPGVTIILKVPTP
jgi:ABC-type phosphate transport system substrate-binding protein